MNLRIFFITFAILLAAIAIYPPYTWGDDEAAAFRKLDDVAQFLEVDRAPHLQYLPITKHAWLFSESAAPIDVTRYRKDSTRLTAILHRRLSIQMLAMESILIIAVALFVGAITARKSKPIR